VILIITLIVGKTFDIKTATFDFNDKTIKGFINSIKKDELFTIVTIANLNEEYIKIYIEGNKDIPNYGLLYVKGNIDNIFAEGKFTKGFVCTDVLIDAYADYPKRVELHTYSKLSQMEGLNDPNELIDYALEQNITALAITDKFNIQNIPRFYNNAIKKGIKPIFGTETSFVNSNRSVIKFYDNIINAKLSDLTFTIFDIETTGLDPYIDNIIEIGAVKIRNGIKVDEFQQLIAYNEPLSEFTKSLTGITDEMLKGQPHIEEVLSNFYDFIKDTVLIAHNAEFDYWFIKNSFKRFLKKDINNSYIDTLALARKKLDMRSYRLDKVATKLKLGTFNHHRAKDDAEIAEKIFSSLTNDIKNITGIINLNNANLKDFGYLVTILMKNKKGFKELNKIVSETHTEFFYNYPKIPEDKLFNQYNDLLFASGLEGSEIAEMFFRGYDIKEIIKSAQKYDYFEVAPLETYNNGITDATKTNYIRFLYKLSKKLNKSLVVVTNSKYLTPDKYLPYKTLRSFDNKRANTKNPFFTTKRLYFEFMKIFKKNKKIVNEILFVNPENINKQIEEFKPLENKLHTPTIENAEELLKQYTYEGYNKIYKNVKHEFLEARIKRELDAIIGNGYAVLYLLARMVVKHSEEHGYVVGSRGSVGSSFVAYLSGITEVNPLPPHYYCPHCGYIEFAKDNQYTRHYNNGYDLPPKQCSCGKELEKSGTNIPFETFMGFEGDKIPD